MARTKKQVKPRTFFLNEKHELTPVEKGGGGRLPQYVDIPWAAKAKRINKSLKTVQQDVKKSRDPLKNQRYFVVANPVSEVEKYSKDKKKAPQGIFKEKTEFGGLHGKVLDRLGMDLLQVTDDGKAVVHAEKGKFDQVLERSASLETLGGREQSRWATIDSFETIPVKLRVDEEWVKQLTQNDPADIVIELQPVLTTVEADLVLRVIADLLAEREGEKLTGTGTDFSGRHWFRGKATRQSVRAIAKDFFSVQAIHSPLYSIAAGKGASKGKPVQLPSSDPPPDVDSLPCVAVVDLGVPADHKFLKEYKRGQFVPPGAPKPPIGDHGSFVASRVVFGECDTADDLAISKGLCSFYDAMVGEYPFISGRTDQVDDKLVLQAISGVRGAAPDVRVFNLSFSHPDPLHDFWEVQRREERLLVQNLDNFVFANDTLVVVAAGNSKPGVVSNPEYPDHYDDPRWSLGPWACGFNTLVCGSFVPRLSTKGLGRKVGCPSPFTRIGPGLCGAPVPSFSAEGGDTDDTFNWSTGLGVWGFSGAALAEDRSGTSHAAPILAREAALALHELQQYCAPGTQPFAVTARAFLTLTADQPIRDDPVKTLVERTLGYGKANTGRLIAPAAGSAVILW